MLTRTPCPPTRRRLLIVGAPIFLKKGPFRTAWRGASLDEGPVRAREESASFDEGPVQAREESASLDEGAVLVREESASLDEANDSRRPRLVGCYGSTPSHRTRASIGPFTLATSPSTSRRFQPTRMSSTTTGSIGGE
jgi:hypothetical protein